MSILDVSDIHSGYGETKIIHGVSITVEHGETVVVIGPNGAGKSTLLKTIFGLLRPAQGTVCLHGEDITGMSPEKIVRMGICYVPQVDNIFPSLTVLENLEMGAFIRKDDLGTSLREVYKRFPVLEDKKRVKAGKLSGGEQQMVAMGRALMLNPRVLLLDEPTAGLSPLLVQEMFQKIQEIKENGVSTLIVEQNAAEALKYAERGYVLAMGKNRFHDTGEKLLSNPEVGKLYLGA